MNQSIKICIAPLQDPYPEALPTQVKREKQSSAVCETENRHRVEGAFDLRKVRSRFSDQPQKNGSGCRRMGEDPNARCLKKKHRSTCMTMLAQVGAYPCNQIRNTNDRTTRYIYALWVWRQAQNTCTSLILCCMDMWSVLANSPMSPR